MIEIGPVLHEARVRTYGHIVGSYSGHGRSDKVVLYLITPCSYNSRPFGISQKIKKTTFHGE